MRKQHGCDFVTAKRNPNVHKEEFTTILSRKAMTRSFFK